MARKRPVVEPDPVAEAAVRTSMVPIRIGKRVYSAVLDPRCPVCTHPGRVKVEERILFNESYATIAHWVSGHDVERVDGFVVAWPELSAAQIARHFRSHHCPIDARLLHELSEQRSGELDYENLSGRVVDHVVFAQQTVARTQERMVRGEIEPSVREGIAAAKLVAAIELAGGENEQQDRTWFYEQAFEVYFGAARQIMTDEQWSAFSRSLTQNPILAQLTERAQRAEDVTDVEVLQEVSP